MRIKEIRNILKFKEMKNVQLNSFKSALVETEVAERKMWKQKHSRILLEPKIPHMALDPVSGTYRTMLNHAPMVKKAFVNPTPIDMNTGEQYELS